MLYKFVLNYFRLKIFQWFLGRFLGSKNKYISKLTSSNKLVFILEFLPLILKELETKKSKK